MSRVEAREILGIAEFDEATKRGLEEYRDALKSLLELMKNPQERKEIRTSLKAISVLLKEHDYVEE